MGSVPIVVIPHPLAGNKPDAVQEKAVAIVDEILAILAQPAEKLAEEYRGRFLKPSVKKIKRALA